MPSQSKLLTLPPEILTQILLYVPFPYHYCISLVHPLLLSILTTSPALIKSRYIFGNNQDDEEYDSMMGAHRLLDASSGTSFLRMYVKSGVVERYFLSSGYDDRHNRVKVTHDISACAKDGGMLDTELMWNPLAPSYESEPEDVDGGYEDPDAEGEKSGDADEEGGEIQWYDHRKWQFYVNVTVTGTGSWEGYTGPGLDHRDYQKLKAKAMVASQQPGDAESESATGDTMKGSPRDKLGFTLRELFEGFAVRMKKGIDDGDFRGVGDIKSDDRMVVEWEITECDNSGWGFEVSVNKEDCC
ncbi:hypothetical protein ABW19_dt0200809 [Dactylella cylindrospora]|nr:hypothetical protein ABW19_dt0200809 [Dactylella cylindrospora]